MVERTFGRRLRKRRMSKDDERTVQTSETLLDVAMNRLKVARLGRRRVYSCDEGKSCLKPISRWPLATEGWLPQAEHSCTQGTLVPGVPRAGVDSSGIVW